MTFGYTLYLSLFNIAGYNTLFIAHNTTKGYCVYGLDDGLVSTSLCTVVWSWIIVRNVVDMMPICWRNISYGINIWSFFIGLLYVHRQLADWCTINWSFCTWVTFRTTNGFVYDGTLRWSMCTFSQKYCVIFQHKHLCVQKFASGRIIWDNENYQYMYNGYITFCMFLGLFHDFSETRCPLLARV